MRDSSRNNNRDLKFDHHVNNVCKKAFQKLNARAAQVSPSINIDKKRIVMKAFIELQFGYCPLVCMLQN